MRFLAKDSSEIGLEVSDGEWRVIHNALNEVCNGFEVRPFETRIGCTLAEARSLLSSIDDAHMRERTSENKSVLKVKKINLLTIRNSLWEVLRAIDDWEFQLRMDFSREQVTGVLQAVGGLIDTLEGGVGSI